MLPHMFSLVLYGRAITDYGLKLLEKCERLRELHLVETSVTDKGLASLENIRTLRWLSIDDANITDKGISYLKNLSQLEGLQLVKTRTSDDGLSVLLNYPKLAYLEASGCSISEKGVLFISQVTSLNSLRLAAPTILDDAFLGLSFCKRLSNFSYDMPLVSQKAVMELHSRLPECDLSHYTFFRAEDKVLFLINNFVGEGKSLTNFSDALNTANELLSYSPYHPALHSARAMINFRMGNFELFRQDLRIARDSANIYGQNDLLEMAINYLNQDSFFGLRLAMEAESPEKIIAAKLLTAGVRPPLRKEPIAVLINRLSNSTSHGLGKPITIAQARATADAFITPEYRHPSVVVDLSNRTTLILPKETKDELKTVPWNW